MQIQKRVLGLFAVIESPILVFSAQKELIYALWPRLVGFGRTVDLNQEKRQRQQEIESKTEQMLSQALLQLLPEPAESVEPAEPDVALDSSVMDDEALALAQDDAVVADNANLSSAQLKRQEVLSRAQELLQSWRRNVGDPMLLHNSNDMGGILLPNNAYVLIGPIAPTKVTVKHGGETIVSYVENRTARLASNLWLNLMKERSKVLVHTNQLAVSEESVGAEHDGGLEQVARDELLTADPNVQEQKSIASPVVTATVSTASAPTTQHRGSESLLESSNALPQDVSSLRSQHSVAGSPQGLSRADISESPASADMVSDGTTSASGSGSNQSSNASLGHMTLEQLVAGKGVDDGLLTEAVNSGALSGNGTAGMTNELTEASSEAAVADNKASALGGLGAGSTSSTARATSTANSTVSGAAMGSDGGINSLLQSLSGMRNYDFSQILAAQHQPYNPMDGSILGESFQYDDEILSRLNLAPISTVHLHNQLRNEVLVQEAVREGDVEKLRWAYKVPPKGKAGILGFTPLRSWKNHAHISNILASRAAIDAGISPEEAYTLSDKLFLVVEELKDPLLAKHMRYIIYLAFTEQVRLHNERLHQGSVRIEPMVVQKARFLIQQQLFTALSLGGLATQLGCTPEHLARSFKLYHGQSVMHYVQQERIAKSKELLLESNTKICDIAATLHFASSAHFCKVFKEHEHLSPAKWRAQHATLTES